MSNSRQKSGKDALNTVVGKDSVLEGSFEVREGIRVDGTLKGQLTASGTLVVGPSGRVEADPIRVYDAVVAGHLIGKLEAAHRVKLEPSAVLTGDITARVLVIEEGAVFHGFCDAGDKTDLDLSPGPRKIETEQAKEGQPVEVKKVVG